MGRMKVGIALTGAVLALLGVVAVITMHGDSSPKAAVSAATQEPGTTATTAPAATVATVAPSTPGTQTPSTKAQSPTPTTAKAPANTATSAPLPAQPTAQDIQRVIEGITSQVLAGNTSASTKPLTKEEVEAQVREQLKQFGISF